MKANQKHLKVFQDEEAVSPVIAVILMVAITVVLAATVFVLVNDLGKNVGSTGPSLGMVTDSASSSNSAWTVKMSSATKLADLTDYKFIISTPSQGTIVVSPVDNTFTTGEVWYADVDSAASARYDAATAYATTNDVAYQVSLVDVDGNSKWSVGDKLNVLYDDDDGATWNADADTDTFPSGEYALEILHTPSGSSAGSLPRTVG